jgi:hypothetical protein
VKNRFQNLPFKFNLQRYTEEGGGNDKKEEKKKTAGSVAWRFA